KGAPHLEQTPAEPFVPNVQKLTIDGKVDDTGKLDAVILRELRGDSEVIARQQFYRASKSQWQQMLEGLSEKDGFGKDVSEIKVSELGATRQPFTYSYRVAKANFLDPSKTKIELKLPLPLQLTAASSDDADSQEPFKLGEPVAIELHLNVKLP